MPRPENPPAFPYEVQTVVDGLDGGSGGMSLRDYFAAKVLPTIVQADWNTDRYQWSQVASMAYDIADAMLAERER